MIELNESELEQVSGGGCPACRHVWSHNHNEDVVAPEYDGGSCEP